VDECVAVAHLGPPTANKMHLVLGDGRHLRVPIAHKLSILIHLVWFHLVEHDGMDILAASQDLREAALNVLVEVSASKSPSRAR